MNRQIDRRRIAVESLRADRGRPGCRCRRVCYRCPLTATVHAPVAHTRCPSRLCPAAASAIRHGGRQTEDPPLSPSAPLRCCSRRPWSLSVRTDRPSGEKVLTPRSYSERVRNMVTEEGDEQTNGERKATTKKKRQRFGPDDCRPNERKNVGLDDCFGSIAAAVVHTIKAIQQHDQTEILMHHAHL